MQNSTKYPVFLFFSEVEAIGFSESAASLIAWAGPRFPLSCLKLARELIARIEAPEHRITLEGAEDLLAMLGTCCLTTDNGELARDRWRNCVRILSAKISEIPE